MQTLKFLSWYFLAIAIVIGIVYSIAKRDEIALYFESDEMKIYREIEKAEFASYESYAYTPTTVPFAVMENDTLVGYINLEIDTLSYEEKVERNLIYQFGIDKFKIYKKIKDSVDIVNKKRAEEFERKEAINRIKTEAKKDSLYQIYLKEK